MNAEQVRLMLLLMECSQIGEPGDLEALAGALDEHRRRALAAATSSYTWDAHQQRLLDAYEPLIRRSVNS